MKDWDALLAVALVILVGTAAGLAGTAAFLLTVLVAWYLLTARDHGFARAAIGVRLEPPLWRRDNWLWLERLFYDGPKLFKAAALGLIVTACALMFGITDVLGVAAIVAAFYASEIHRARTTPPRRAVRIRDAGAAAAAHVAPAAVTSAATASTKTTAAPLPTTIFSSTAVIVRPATKRRTVTRVIERPRSKRPLGRGAAAKPPRKRSRRKFALQPARTKPPLPGLKQPSPTSLKSRKPPRPRPPLRGRRRVRKPMTLVSRNTSAPPTTSAPH